jgi:hypothetical protein
MYIRIENNADPSSSTHNENIKALVILNTLFAALFLCPRPSTPGRAGDIAPLPHAASSLMLPSVFMGLSLGIAPTKLKTIGPALSRWHTPLNAYNDIIVSIADMATDSAEGFNAQEFKKPREALRFTDHFFLDTILNDSGEEASRITCETQLGEKMESVLRYLPAAHRPLGEQLLEKHKRLTRLPDSMPSAKARQVV